MHQLFPLDDRIGTEPISVDDIAHRIGTEPREHADGRPWVFANMVTTIDGAATLDGRSAGLGGPGDKVVFSALRAEADVIVVGAQTVRDERYRLTRAPGDAAARRRVERGQGQRARLCIVTRATNLGGAPPLLDELPAGAGAGAEDWRRPIIATVHHDPGAVAADPSGFDDRFDVIEVGDGSVDLGALIEELGRRGLRRVLCEGGPSLLAQMGAAALVDEWNFTVAPIVAGGTAVRPVHAPVPLGTRLRLERLLIEDDSTMFTRYLTDRAAG